MATHSTFRENFLRVVAVIGLIAILLLGAWGIIQLAFYLPTLFGGLGQTKEAMTMSVPVESTSDKPITVSWKHTGGSGEYSYNVSYSCAAGLQFAVPVPTGSYQLVPCDTSFDYINATSSMQIIPVLQANARQASTTVTVAATKLSDGTIAVKATGKTTVLASTTAATPASGSTASQGGSYSAPSKPTTTKPSSTYYASGRTTNLYGYADLAVQITSAPQQVPAGSRIALQFVVTNVGTNVAPTGWTFLATLPYNPIYTYPAGGQQALYPGDRIVYTLGYDAVQNNYGGYGNAAQTTIQVDSNNFVPEQNEQNNIASVSYQVY